MATAKEQQNSLTQAIKYGKYSAVEKLLSGGCDPNCRVNDAVFTPVLILAVTTKKLICLQLLLKYGAAVDACDRLGMTAAMYASDRGMVDYLHNLVESRADVNKVNDDGVNSLMLAAKWDSFDCVEYLLQLHADIDHQDVNGKTALMYAAIHGSVECLQSLVDARANLNLADIKKGFTALLFALEHRNIPCATILLQSGAKVNVKGKGKEHETTALTLAFRNSKEIGEYSMIEELLTRGADMTLSRLDQNFLHEMVARNKQRIVRLMLTNGCPPFNRKCVDYLFKFSEYSTAISPLCVALLSGFHDIAKYFIANCFLTSYDVKVLPNDVGIRAKLHERGETSREALAILTLMSSPLSLKRLSFITISEMINKVASTTSRRYKIMNSGLPQRLQSDLLFSKWTARICIVTWHELLLEEDQELEKCSSCGECGGTGFRLKQL